MSNPGIYKAIKKGATNKNQLHWKIAGPIFRFRVTQGAAVVLAAQPIPVP